MLHKILEYKVSLLLVSLIVVWEKLESIRVKKKDIEERCKHISN